MSVWIISILSLFLSVSISSVSRDGGEFRVGGGKKRKKKKKIGH